MTSSAPPSRSRRSRRDDESTRQKSTASSKAVLTSALAPLIQEIRLYSWSKHALLSGRGHDTTQGADHACDPLRYLCQELWTSGAR